MKIACRCLVLVATVSVMTSVCRAQVTRPAPIPRGDTRPVSVAGTVRGLWSFEGSHAERQRLEYDGFVVTTETVPHFFSAYRPGGALPFFITTDAVWHAFTFLLRDLMLDLDGRLAPIQAEFVATLLRVVSKDDSKPAYDVACLLSLAACLQSIEVDAKVSAGPAYQWAKRFLAGQRTAKPEGLSLSMVTEAAMQVDPAYALRGLSGYFRARRVLQLAEVADTDRGKAAAMLLERCLASTDGAAERLRLLELPSVLLGWETNAPGEPRRVLLPAIRLPSFRVWERTTEACGRVLPSAGDLLVVGPMASTAGRSAFRASRYFDAKVEAAVRPNLTPSFYLDAYTLLAELTKPLPATAPASLRSEAWLRKQCETQLAGWAELRMVASLHGAIYTLLVRGSDGEAEHMVSPYPAFFAALGRLADRAVKLIDGFEAKVPTDLQAMARSLKAEDEQMKRASLDRRYHASRVSRLLQSEWFDKLIPNVGEGKAAIEFALSRGVRGEPLDGRSKEILVRAFHGAQPTRERLLRFQRLTEMLARVAGSQLAGQPIEPADSRRLERVGEELARIECYEANNWRHKARDDFPRSLMVARYLPVGGAPEVTTMVVGVARPRLLYVIAEARGVRRLYRGAVSTYRELRCPVPPGEQEWRQMCDALPPLFPATLEAHRLGGR